MSTGVIAVRYGARCAKCAIGLDCSGREGSTHAECANVQLAQSGFWTIPQGTLFACASCRCGRPCHCRSHVLDYCRHCGHHGSTCCCHFSSVKATATATTHHRTPTLSLLLPLPQLPPPLIMSMQRLVLLWLHLLFAARLRITVTAVLF